MLNVFVPPENVNDPDAETVIVDVFALNVMFVEVPIFHDVPVMVIAEAPSVKVRTLEFALPKLPQEQV